MKDCNQCGKCCIKYGGGDLSATQTELEHWEIHHPEIFKYVKDNKIWFEPQSGEKMDRCPFLNVEPKQFDNAPDKYTCSIYQHRPEDCRIYPSLISEMIRDECEMIDASDLTNPTKAQQRLDFLMNR